MSANSQVVFRSWIGTLRQLLCSARIERATIEFPILLILFITLLAAPAWPQGGSITLLDTSNQAGPGPGDVVINQTPFGTFVYNASFVTGQPGEIVTHRLEPDGRLTFLTRTPAGREPRQMALARGGEFLVVVNSIDNEIRALRIKNGIPQPVEDTDAHGGFLTDKSSLTDSIFASAGTNPAPSGGLDPFDIDAFDDWVVTVSRGSNNICLSRIDEFGRIVRVICTPTGVAPHVVSVSRRDGRLVVVANDVGQSVDIFKTDGNTLEYKSTTALPARPRDVELIPLSQALPRVMIALDTPGAGEDVIRGCSIGGSGQVANCTDTPAGHFLTDIDVVPNMFIAAPDFDPGLNMLFAATVNINGPGGADDRDEIRTLRIDRNTGLLSLVGSVQTPTVPPNFKQLGIDRTSGLLTLVGSVTVVSTEFQSNSTMRSFRFKGN